MKKNLSLFSLLILLNGCHSADNTTNKGNDSLKNESFSEKGMKGPIDGKLIPTVKDTAFYHDTIPTAKPDSNQYMPVARIDSLNKYL
jgi:major membrane immunogen (membrane-anchored lipoprotein)